MKPDAAKTPARVLINPTAAQIGRVNSILWGRAKQYHVAEFPGPLSVKSVVRGSAIWGTREAERLVDGGNFLVLNAGHPYSITIDARETVETFCLFFRAGFAEDVSRVETGQPQALLDDPSATGAGNGRVEFFETLNAKDESIAPLLKKMHAAVSTGSASEAWLEDQFFAAAKGLLKLRRNAHREAMRISAKKAATREELYRRLLRGRDYMDSFYGEEAQLEEIAGAACVSPYHFHRLFREVFRQTPNQYLQRRRLQRARELLASTDRGITEISLDVGFESSTSFSALFRRTFGYSPREYRSLRARSARSVSKK